MRGRRVAGLAIVAVALVACGGGGKRAAPPTTTVTSTSTTTTSTSTTTTTPPKFIWPAVDTSGPGVFVSPNGVVLPMVGDGLVDTPCGNQSAPVGEPVLGTNVVIDPGHGGNEPGAVGPSGLTEKDVNLDVAQDVQLLLEAEGANVV